MIKVKRKVSLEITFDTGRTSEFIILQRAEDEENILSKFGVFLSLMVRININCIV